MIFWFNTNRRRRFIARFLEAGNEEPLVYRHMLSRCHLLVTGRSRESGRTEHLGLATARSRFCQVICLMRVEP